MRRDVLPPLSATLLIAALAAPACGKEEGGGPATAAPPPAPTADRPEPRSLRGALASHRPLLDEVARAELRVDGLLVDFGAPDQHKYTRGGWATGWGALREAPAAPAGGEAVAPATSSDMVSRRAWLDLGPAGPAPRALALRARSAVAGQTLSFHVGGRQLGAVSLGASWAVVRTEIAAGPLPGGARLELRAGRAGAAGGAAAELDWLWLGAEPGARPPEPGPRTGQLTIGGKVRRTIAAATARTYSFYLTPPPGSHFVADLGASGKATFAVTATADGAEPVELLRDTVSAAWRERAVPLEAFAGKPIRLDLVTSAQDGEAGWGEPEIALTEGSPLVARPAAGQGARPENVIVILIDTARADAFGPFAGEDRVARTPRYDALAAESTVFVSAYNNENWTKPSVATTLSGLYPSTHDTKRDASELPAEVELLSQRLKKDGFATAGFVANGYVSEKFGFERGWDRFKNYIRESLPSEAEHVYGDALAWLRKHRASSPDKPFFLYIQTIDPHVRYDVPEKYWRPYFEGSYRGPLGPTITAADQLALTKKKIKPDRRNVSWLRALYYGEITYHDEHMGRFLDELGRLGVRDRTLLVVTNDHGEELGERGRYGHGHQVHEELVRAPLLISYPPLFPPGERAEIVEHVDLAPTLLDALGRDPLARADGQSFLPLVRGMPTPQPRYAITEFLDDRRVVRVDRQKLIVSAGGGRQLYDLDADPGEREEASARRPIARRLCEVHLGEGLAVPDKATRMRGVRGGARLRAGTADIDPEMRRQLEALGYFGAGPEEAPRGKKN